MPSPPALQYGQYYHIYNRGNNRENIFVEDRNYRRFLQLYAKYVEPVADTYAYCLLRNHFHLLVRIKTQEEQEQAFNASEAQKAFKISKPGQQFGNLFNAYAKAFNKAYDRTGSLFQNPFKRILVTSDAYFVHLITYIHQNPSKHGFVDDFRAWPYSSYQAVVSQKPTRLQRDAVLAWFDGPEQFEKAHQREASAAHIAPLVAEDFY